MKKTLINTLLSLGIVFGSLQQAQAFIIVTAFNGQEGLSPQMRGTCILLLPLCLLDGREANRDFVNKDDLLANGYDEVEADTIIYDQYMIYTNAQEKNLMLVVGENDTAESLEVDLKTLHPETSDIFVDYFLDRVGI